MGAINSTNVDAKEVQSTINELSISVAQSCVTDSDISQSITVNGNNNVLQDILENQSVQNNLSCFTSSQNQVQLAQDLSAKLAAKAQSNSGFVFGLFANSAVIDSTTVQEIVEKQMISTLQACTQTFNQDQGIYVNGNYNQIVNATLSQNGINYAKCVFGSNNIDQVTQKISADMDAQADASASVISNWIVIIIIVAVIVVGGAILIWWAKRRSSRGGNSFNFGKSGITPELTSESVKNLE